MNTTIWACCPKCQTELKIDTDETELVQIECPDCHKVFAAKVPARSAAPVQDVFSQMPVLPAFQPARVHYKPTPKSNDSMNPAVLTALIVGGLSVILIPLGFGGFYLYGKLSEASSLATTSSNSTPVTNSNLSSPSMANAPVFMDSSNQSSTDKKTTPPTDPVAVTATTNTTTAKPQSDSTSQPDPTFGVPELNPPKLIQSESSAPQITQTPNSTTSPMPTGSSSPSQVQVSVSGPGTSKSGLPVPFHRFVGSNGVFIFVLHPKGHSVNNAVQELQKNLSVQEIHSEGSSDHTTIGFRYSGSVDSVAKGIRFGKVSYADEESRSIHVQAN